MALVPGMKWRGGPRVVLLARRLGLGIRCDRPGDVPTRGVSRRAWRRGWPRMWRPSC